MKEPTTPILTTITQDSPSIGGIDGADVPGQAMYGYAIVGANGVEVSLEGNVGLAYEGKVYAGNGESVSIGLSGPEGYNPSAGYNASAGTLTPNGTTWTLVMPQEDVTISPDIARNVSTHGMAPGVYDLRLIDGDSVMTQKIILE